MAEFMNYSNLHEENADRKTGADPVKEKDKSIIRDLAKHWVEIAKSDEMKERKRLWKAFSRQRKEGRIPGCMGVAGIPGDNTCIAQYVWHDLLWLLSTCP